jgi:hypothetical protein
VRARSLKPSFFKNELLAVADPLHSLVFAGLWCLADREGRLEDRPARIHFDINPGRSFDSTVASLDWLAANSFITRYRIGAEQFIQVDKFGKHQNPHVKEPPSKIPKPGASLVLTPVSGSIYKSETPDEHQTDTSPARLTPDSGLRTPHSLATPPDGGEQLKSGSPVFEEIRRAYPKRSGSQRWQDAENSYKARVREGHTHEEILAGVLRYVAYVKAQGHEGSSFVQQAATFLGTNRGFLEPWSTGGADPYANAV